MTDYGSLQSPKNNYRQHISSFFSSPRMFYNFTALKSCNDNESINSPTSVLDSKSFSALRNPFWSDTNRPKTPKLENKSPWENLDTKGVGLGLIDALIDEKPSSNFLKPENMTVLLGSQLKIQVPLLSPSAISPNESPRSPGDFGIKTRNSHVGLFSPRLSPSPVKISPFSSDSFSSLSASEMELSEDYTCVISYGPNPKTTHIFDDCIVEKCCGVVKLSESRKENGFLSDKDMHYPSDSFLRFCFNCKKNLGQGKDIYMYRGEKAFCSSECRSKEMMLEAEGQEPLRSNHVYGTSS